MKKEFTILEDASPFYIRFTFEGIENLVSACKNYLNFIEFSDDPFIHFKAPPEIGNSFLKKLPFDDLDLNGSRASFFITRPGYYYRAHKDGLDHRFSLNLTVEINDSLCVTSWYDDKELSIYPIDTLQGMSRECLNFKKENHNPVKSMTAKQGEFILFNTEIWHDFDNSNSNNRRIVLTLRHTDPKNWYFEDVKKILFNK
jgi:hypothetical protein